jgi:hypothetical protein
MKRWFIGLIVLLLVAGLPARTLAQYNASGDVDRSPASSDSLSPVAVSMFDPIQWPGRSNSVSGVRFNFIYAEHKNLTGLDLGLLLPVNRLTRDMTGLQFGLFNGVDRQAGGVQLGVINYVGGDATGIQWGAANLTMRKVTGLQMGVYNKARSVSGAQLGLLNITDSLYGLQVGLGNLKNESHETFPASGPPFFPVFNWSF